MRLLLFLVVNFAFALDWRIKKAAFNDRNEKYEEIMAKIDSADTFDEIQVRRLRYSIRVTDQSDAFIYLLKHVRLKQLVTII